jgi:two-component system cell cycle response regulator
MKVLIVEDDPVTRKLLEVFLNKWGYEVSLSHDGREAWDALSEPDSPSLVISDWMMPHMNGLELCRKVRESDMAHYVYFIILTAKGKKPDVIEALRAGADDYLVKPFDQEELKCRVRIGERIVSLEQRIMEMASTDFLTGSLNRRAFFERMEQEVQRAAREEGQLSVILADIDGFKAINDKHGHNAGDKVLQKFVKTLSLSLRSYDFLGRYGGEEFLVCLPGTDQFQALQVAERMRKLVEKERIALPDKPETIQITASFGVASHVPGSEGTVLYMTRRADEAMYRAKRSGKNRVCGGDEKQKSSSGFTRPLAQTDSAGAVT